VKAERRCLGLSEASPDESEGQRQRFLRKNVNINLQAAQDFGTVLP